MPFGKGVGGDMPSLRKSECHCEERSDAAIRRWERSVAIPSYKDEIATPFQGSQ